LEAGFGHFGAEQGVTDHFLGGQRGHGGFLLLMERGTELRL
jgi:hypothetical protein